MPFYPGLKRFDRGKDAAQRLIELRKQISEEIPKHTIGKTLLLATWNIRDFDSNKFGYGPRLEESFYYIAEIISAFDLVAVQEVNEDLKALKKVMSILGRAWDFIVTDVTEGRSGNNERMAFVYDTRKVSFRNIAGEIVLPESDEIGGEEVTIEMPEDIEITMEKEQEITLPDNRKITIPKGQRILLPQKQAINLPEGQKIANQRQFARTPFIVSFQAGWFKFNLCTVHLYYGEQSGPKLKRRIQEIDRISGFLAKRAKGSNENFIMLGDFNIVNPDDETMFALNKHGYIIPSQLEKIPTNMFGSKHYDQIAFMVRKDELQLGESEPNAGALNFYKTLFTPEDFDVYHEIAKKGIELNNWDMEEDKKEKYYLNKWRTFQMSDHLLMWVELKIDFSEEYLKKI